MSDEDLRKLAGYVVDALAIRLVGGGMGMAELIKEAEIDELTEAEKEALETQEALLEFITKYEEPDG